MVSPTYKAGYGTNAIVAVAPDGESVAFDSIGAFVGDPINDEVTNDYIAHRGSGAWLTMPLQTPPSIAPSAEVLDFSESLDLSLSGGKPGPNSGIALYDGGEYGYWLHSTSFADIAEGFELAGTVLKDSAGDPFTPNYTGASADLSHLLFYVDPPVRLSPTVGGLPQLYDLATGSLGGERLLRLAGLNNKGTQVTPECKVMLGVESGKASSFNAAADNGGQIFFSTGVTNNCSGTQQLFMRAAGSKTVEVSAPWSPCLSCPVCPEMPCPGAESRAPSEFQGANETGTVVFFTTAESLLGGDTDLSEKLYMARIGCAGGEAECEREPVKKQVASLVDVSRAGEPAGVQGVVAVSQDGSHVYFVARGLLSEGSNAEGKMPVKGADNLYVYDSTTGGRPAFMAELCSGPELSGIVEDIRCPASLISSGANNDSGLWVSASPEAQTADGGRVLLFSSFGRLVPGDTDIAKDVYRYDAASGTLQRVSVGEAGRDTNGNDGLFAATITPTVLHRSKIMNSRAISEDGKRIVFETAEPLSAAAVNGLENAYEWYDEPGSSEGSVSLISTGAATEPVEQVAISQSGRDVFFKTTQSLLAQDVDLAADIYDARLAGGFPPPPTPRQPCSGDACQGPLTSPAALLVPGSVSQTPGESLSSPKKPMVELTRARQLARALKVCANKPKRKRAACRSSARKKYAKAGESAGRGR